MSRVECIMSDVNEQGQEVEVLLMEPRPFRPFKSSEEYLVAMKEDLAEWLGRLYHPHLEIDAENFMDVLEDGVVLCKHANNVRSTAVAYKEKWEQQGRRRSSRKFSTHMDIPDRDVLYRSEVKPKSFFARDNVHNFITWCRLLGIYECLLFETDDLVLRKNEKSVILCLLEVARRGAHFGMPAPMLVQFEKEIDREIAQEANGGGIGGDGDGAGNGAEDEDDDDDDDAALVEYGPHAQIVTNDLRSLDEMVRELVENCSCPTQFPMIRISEGKYRIGDTKMLIFVRVLRNHVMVRVGGGWDTLSHFLEKHDPCRCRSGHRNTVASKLSVTQNVRGNTQMAVSYERATSPPTSRRSSSASNATTPSRKNSISGGGGGGGGVTSPVYSSPFSPLDGHVYRSRQRSTSPSAASRTPSRHRNQSPGKTSPVFQRPIRYHHQSGQRSSTPSTPTQLSHPGDAAQGNLDSLESYDSGISFDRRSANNRLQSSNGSGRQRVSIDSNSSDSSSEVSDDGYRTAPGGAPIGTADERPDSSCTQASSSTAESGVSSIDAAPPTTPHRSAPKAEKQSRIPLLGSLRGGGGVAKHQASAQRNADETPASSRPGSRPVSRRNSINSDTSTGSSSPAPFNRHTFGRHSLRLRNSSTEAPKTTPTPTHIRAQAKVDTWNGRNKQRERPALNAELFSPTKSAAGQRSRSVTYRGSSSVRATSTSPNRLARRAYNVSIPSSPDSATPTAAAATAFNWKATSQQQQNSRPSDKQHQESPLKSILKDLENDSDACILKKMEEIVNQYKARVEGILAAEGRTLEEAWHSSDANGIKGPHQRHHQRTQRASVELNGRHYHPSDQQQQQQQSSSQRHHLSRRRSFDSSGAAQPPIRVAPRKDTVTSSPSKIPMPLFYRSKEACV